MTTFTLPYPPSVNSRHGFGRRRVWVGRKTKDYETEVVGILLNQRIKKITGQVSVSMVAYPPDNRVRDGDNIRQTVYNAIKGRVIEDDSNRFVRRDSLVWAEQDDNKGRVEVTIEQIGNRE